MKQKTDLSTLNSKNKTQQINLRKTYIVTLFTQISEERNTLKCVNGTMGDLWEAIGVPGKIFQT